MFASLLKFVWAIAILIVVPPGDFFAYSSENVEYNSLEEYALTDEEINDNLLQEDNSYPNSEEDSSILLQGDDWSYSPKRNGDPDVFIDKYKKAIYPDLMVDEEGTRIRWRKLYQKYLKESRGKPLPEPTANDLERIDMRLNDAELKETNKYREKHGAAALEFDPKIASFAQRYADKLARDMTTNGNRLEHNQLTHDYKLGENLAELGLSSPAYLGESTKMWYDEIKDYIANGNQPILDHSHGAPMTGHFTQVVWKATKKMGCGVGYYTTGRGSNAYKDCVVVCDYSPPGNYNNMYQENVQV